MQPLKLEKIIKEKPLTKKRVNYVLQNKIEDIEFYESWFNEIVTLKNGKYKIFISLDSSLEEQQRALIHEICHAYYEKIPSQGFVTPDSELEAKRIKEMLIEKEAQHFYRENEDFIKQIFLSKLL